MSFVNERNLEIYQKKENGATLALLSSEYGLSTTRIWQIVRKMRRIKEKEAELKKGFGNKIMNAYDYVRLLVPDAPGELAVRSVNCVCRKNVHEHPGMHRDYRIFIEALMPMTYEDCLKMRNCGVKSAEFLMCVKEKQKSRFEQSSL